MNSGFFMKLTRNNYKAALIIFLIFSGFYILTGPKFINTPDGVIMAKLTRSLSSFRLDVEPIPQQKDFGGQYVKDSVSGELKLYPWFAPALSFASVPAYGVSRLIYPLTTEGDRKLLLNSAIRITMKNEKGGEKLVILNTPYYHNFKQEHFSHCWDYLVISWTNSIITAGIISGIFILGLIMGAGSKQSLIFSALVGIATPLWHYAGEYFSEPLAGLCILWSIILILSGKQSNNKWLYAAAGVLFGISFLTKATHIILLVPYVIVLISGQSEFRNKILKAIYFGISSFITGALYPLYNFIRFGNPLDTGYGEHVSYWTTPFLKGAYGLLFSNGRGLFIYAPLIILAIAGMTRAFKKNRDVTLFGISSTLLFVAFYAKWYMWEGGWCWGPRYLIPLLPVILMPAIHLFGKENISPLMRIVKLLIIPVSFLISLSGIIVNYAEYSKYLMNRFISYQQTFLKSGIEDYYDLLLWDPAYSPLFAHWFFPFKNRMMITRTFENPGLIMAISILLIIIITVSLFYLIKKRELLKD